ncbi:dihydrofolate reductase [Candidatus Poribacteria bacterium]|nr:MAG: dihydrofolate reductase [Candidatus Poribacteria bacterium]
MIISIIAGMDKNRLIGQGNRLPWRLPADMKHFRRHTLGKSVLMGRKTFESIGKPLPKRTNIILTNDRNYQAKGCIVTHSIEEAMDMASGCKEIMVIGGASIYELFLPTADRLYLTYIHGCFQGDAYFPAFDIADWQEVKRVDCQPDEKNPHPYSFIFLHRRSEDAQ